MQPSRPCSLCDALVGGDEIRRVTPRELAGMKIASENPRARALRESAVAIVTANQPPGAADRPTWWLCASCLGSVLVCGNSTLLIERPKGIDAGLRSFEASATRKTNGPRVANDGPRPAGTARRRRKWIFWK